MGLKSGFNKILRDICPNVFETIHISEYAYKKVAIAIFPLNVFHGVLSSITTIFSVYQYTPY